LLKFKNQSVIKLLLSANPEFTSTLSSVRVKSLTSRSHSTRRWTVYSFSNSFSFLIAFLNDSYKKPNRGLVMEVLRNTAFILMS